MTRPRRTAAERNRSVEGDAETWSGSTILFDKWCPRDRAYFVPRGMPMDFGAFGGLVTFVVPFVVMHPTADPGPVMAANLAAAYRPEGVPG